MEKTGAVLLLSNLGLLIVSLAVVGTAAYLYKRQVSAVTLAENSFLTVEWQLLQELKAETDRKLQEKDREIVRLRDAYEVLRAQGTSELRLERARELLYRAEAERKALLDAAVTVTGAPGGIKDVVDDLDGKELAVDAALPPGNDPLAALLSARVATLQQELDASLERVSRAEKALAALERSAATGSTISSEGPPAVDDTLTELRVLAKRQIETLGSHASLDLSAIRTRSLLRALVSTPDIQSKYPDLPEELERSYELYSREAYYRGQREAWERVLEYIETRTEP